MISESALKRLTTYCLHKVEVRQPFTGERILVPCGTCPACLMRKAYHNEIACKANESLFKYTYFVTLTYNTKTCPRYTFQNVREDSDTGRIIATACVLPRKKLYRSVEKKCKNKVVKIHRKFVSGLSYSDEFSHEFSFDSQYFKDYCEQASLNVDGKYPSLQNSFGYISRKDYALFMKRLRKYFNTRLGYYEKIHTYVVGEYSPKHFRPHFHILFFFDSDELAENFGRAVNFCWKHGRVDYSLSRKTASSYVAGYVNSAARIPYHLNDFREIKTFSRFSNGFRKVFFTKEIESAKRGDFFAFLNGKDFINNGRSWRIYPSVKVLDTCFFPYISTSLSSRELIRTAVFALSKFVTECLDKEVGVSVNLSRFYDSYINNDKWIYEPDWQFLLNGLRLAYGDAFIKRETFVSRFYTIILRFNTTLKSYGLSLYNYRDLLKNEVVVDTILNLSYNYKLEYERKNQKNHYCSDMVNRPCLGKTFWAESQQGIKEFLDSPDGQRLEAYQFRRLNEAVKHRKINDLNIKFVIPR